MSRKTNRQRRAQARKRQIRYNAYLMAKLAKQDAEAVDTAKKLASALELTPPLDKFPQCAALLAAVATGSPSAMAYAVQRLADHTLTRMRLEDIAVAAGAKKSR